MKSISKLQTEVHKNAKAHGFWKRPRPIGELLMLISTELTEAFEEIRDGNHPCKIYFAADGKPEGFPIELADAVLRIMDLCEYYNINLEQALAVKHKYNLTRPYLHGKAVGNLFYPDEIPCYCTKKEPITNCMACIMKASCLNPQN